MRSLNALALLLAIDACNLPKDPDGTLQRVQNGRPRVGIAVHPPWTVDSSGAYGGVEPALVTALAEQLHAKIEWTGGGESVLFPMLHEHQLDINVAGLDAKTPWAKSAASLDRTSPSPIPPSGNWCGR
jgi:polar amino acid transport system substrate-binding protein